MPSNTRSALSRLLPPIAALALAILVALIVLLLPQATLERFAWNTGIAGLIPAAQPPLGTTARLLLAAGLAAFTGAIGWSALFLLCGPGGVFAPRRRDDDTLSVRRADAHPDAPPRRPISAESDFGTPPPPIAYVERALPADLERPLADFDPSAIPPVPQTPAEPVRPLARVVTRPPAERLETFDLPPAAAPTEPPPPPAPPATIETLLRRLEDGAVRRATRDRD